MSIKSLIINPGSTSTKVGVFEDETLLFEETLRHPTEEIAKYASIIDQKDFRKDIILNFLKEKDCDVKSFDVIVGRGGLLKPIPGGTYAVSDALLADLKAGVQGQHASNLGGILAREIGDEIGVPSFIVDPVVVDELTDVARISGMPELPRRSIFHALNQKAVARRYAKENGFGYEELNLIVIHMGGGVSVGAHKKGQVVDVNNILDGEGAFSPERAGTVPVGDLIKLCFSGKYDQKTLYKKICGTLTPISAPTTPGSWRRKLPRATRRQLWYWTPSTTRSPRTPALWPPFWTARWIRSFSPAASPILPRRRRSSTRRSVGSHPSPSTPARTSCWPWPRAPCVS